jgi:hypothetical protein
MEINWIIFAAVLVCAIALIIYLIKRNMKDKKDVINSLNEPEIDEVLKPKEKEEN